MTGIPSIVPYVLPTSRDLPVNLAQWSIDPERAVLLVHDMQRYFLRPLPDALREQVVSNAARIRQWAADNGVPVAYTAQPGSMSEEQRGLLKDFWGPGMKASPTDREVVDALTPKPSDWLLTKWRYSAFFNSDLLERMRANNRDQLILCGVYAHVGVLISTVDAYSTTSSPSSLPTPSPTSARSTTGWPSNTPPAVAPWSSPPTRWCYEPSRPSHGAHPATGSRAVCPVVPPGIQRPRPAGCADRRNVGAAGPGRYRLACHLDRRASPGCTDADPLPPDRRTRFRGGGRPVAAAGDEHHRAAIHQHRALAGTVAQRADPVEQRTLRPQRRELRRDRQPGDRQRNRLREGANFVIKRTFLAEISEYGPASALSFFRHLLEREKGAYWTFIIHTGSRTFVGASPSATSASRMGSR